MREPPMLDKSAVIRYAWDGFIALCATATALSIPVRIVLDAWTEEALFYLDGFITIVYVIDIGVRYPAGTASCSGALGEGAA